MDIFKVYFQLGFEHILDINAYDHMLYLVALCALYTLKEWKQIVVLVTAFTIGHSLTLALSVLDIVTIPSELIETLIPLTIIATGITNLLTIKDPKPRVTYIIALLFGFIHGMGISNYLKSLLGNSKRLALELFSFNIGVEAGMLLVVAGILLLSYLLVHLFGLKQKYWTYGLSILAIIVSLYIMFG